MADRVQLEQKLLEFMRSKGLKQTQQRQVLFDCFVTSEGHLAIEDLLARAQPELPGIGYATVYRTLKLFTEAGIAHERRFQDGFSRYEPAEQGEHHDHLICKLCGHIFEFEDDVVERRQAEVAAAHGMKVVAHRHDIYGECIQPTECTWWQAQAQAQAR